MKTTFLSLFFLAFVATSLWYFTTPSEENHTSSTEYDDSEKTSHPKRKIAQDSPAAPSAPAMISGSELLDFERPEFQGLDHSEKLRIKEELDLAIRTDQIRPEDSEEYVQLLIKDILIQREQQSDDISL